MESRLTVEKWALGNLSPEAVAQLERRAASDEEFAGWAHRVRAEVSAASVDLPPLRLPVKEEAPARPPWRDLFRSLSLAGAAGLAVLAFTLLLPTQPPVAPPAWRGAMDLEIHLIRGGSATEQGAVVTAQAGDRLQYRVAAPSAGYLQVYDVQADRTVQQWLAPQAVAARASETGAVLLDGYDQGERVYFVWHEQPIETGRIADAVERAYETPIADLDALPGLPPGAIQRSILLLRTAK